jgi:hypothetical protein
MKDLMAYNLHETKTDEKRILKQLDEEVMEPTQQFLKPVL